MKTTKILLIALLTILFVPYCYSQTITVADTYKMDKSVPAGNYSGITSINIPNHYALVNDKAVQDGFQIFFIQLDTINGHVVRIEDKGMRNSHLPNRDEEGIAYDPHRQRIYISGENDNRILEYTLEGIYTQRSTPSLITHGPINSGIEALCYDPINQCLWSMEENNGRDSCAIFRISIPDLNPTLQGFYPVDKAVAKKKSRWHTLGVSSILMYDSTRILVLERELFVPKKKIGAWSHVKIYLYDLSTNPTHNTSSQTMIKKLLWEERTKLNITNRSYANYEGMAWGPTLSNGKKTLLVVADSQNRYKGVLHDWLKILTIQ